MTPDDIRHATFDKVRKGIDPEQVRDLLARVAFLLERTPGVDLDALDDAATFTQPEPLISMEAPVSDMSTLGPATTIREPVVDHRRLAETIGAVISATEQLVEWKAELERTAGAVEVGDVVANGLPIEIRGVDELRHRLMREPRLEYDAGLATNGHRVDA